MRESREKEFELPAGWYRVLSGAVKPGDRCLDEDLYWDTGAIRWCAPTTLFLESDEPGEFAQEFLCLIRVGEPVEVVCPCCGLDPVLTGYRYCWACCRAAIRELRRREKQGDGGAARNRNG